MIYKEDVRDFVLWKNAKARTVLVNRAWQGRPVGNRMFRDVNESLEDFDIHAAVSTSSFHITKTRSLSRRSPGRNCPLLDPRRASHGGRREMSIKRELLYLRDLVDTGTHPGDQISPASAPHHKQFNLPSRVCGVPREPLPVCRTSDNDCLDQQR